MIIKHNITSLNIVNRLTKNSNTLSKTMDKLSSGLRINKAADDAAGLAISEKMRAQIRGLEQAKRNIQDGISLIQTAEGGLANILSPPLQRMRELAIQAANDTTTVKDRQIIQNEMNQISKQIDGISHNTEFNGKKLINGENKIISTSTTSPVEITWTEVDTGSTTNFYDVAWNGSLFLAVGFQGDTLASTDGESWYVPSSPVTNVNLNSAKWDGSQFLVTEGGSIYTTTDGVNRTGYSSSISGINGRFFDADFVGGKYLAVGDNGQIATTNDPTVNYSWTSVSSGTSEQLLDIASSGNEYVIVGNNGTILRSTDATNWTSQNSGTTAILEQVIWQNGQYVAVGGNGTILTSNDGVAWSEQATPSGINVIYDITYNGDEYVAVSNDGWILTSKNATSWQDERLDGNPYLQGIAWDGENYLAIGWQGKAFQGTRTINTIVEQAKLEIQLGPNRDDSLAIELSEVTSDSLGINQINVLTNENSNKAIIKIDHAIEVVSSQRSKFGSYQNRLSHASNKAQISTINLTAAESRIRDLDFTKEMIKQTKVSILAQASQAMLAKANQQHQSVLQLLR